MGRSQEKLAVLRGTLDVFVLKSLAARARHGFEISEWLDGQFQGALHLEDSALYQCLHRLEGRGLIDGEWGTSDNNRRARYYRLTAEGRRHLRGETARLTSFARNLLTLLTARTPK